MKVFPNLKNFQPTQLYLYHKMLKIPVEYYEKNLHYIDYKKNTQIIAKKIGNIAK